MPHNVLFTWSLTQGRIVIPYLPVMWVSHCRTLFGGEVAQIEPPPYPVYIGFVGHIFYLMDGRQGGHP